MPPLIDGTVSFHGEYETPRIFGAQWGYWSALIAAALAAVAVTL